MREFVNQIWNPEIILFSTPNAFCAIVCVCMRMVNCTFHSSNHTRNCKCQWISKIHGFVSVIADVDSPIKIEIYLWQAIDWFESSFLSPKSIRNWKFIVTTIRHVYIDRLMDKWQQFTVSNSHKSLKSNIYALQLYKLAVYCCCCQRHSRPFNDRAMQNGFTFRCCSIRPSASIANQCHWRKWMWE